MKNFIFILILLSWNEIIAQINSTSQNPIKNSERTNKLLNFLQYQQGKKVLFGHQDDLAYGIGWKYKDTTSDVKKVVGSYPAVFGWEIGHLELGKSMSLDSVPFVKMREYIKEVYKLGAINTISWHLNNPVNGASSWDSTKGTIALLLPGRSHNRQFALWLDRVANFIHSLKDDEGNLIPIIFRPYHENSQSWFWWGKNENSDADFIALWRYTIDYLKRKKGLNNLLIAFSAANFDSIEDYESRYPGDDYVDIVGFDTYDKPEKWNYKAIMQKQLYLLQNIASSHKKIAAITETGSVTIQNPDWWTTILLPLLYNFKISYILVWRNARLDHFYAPYPGQGSANDFKKFFTDSLMLFQNGLSIEPSVYH